VVGNDLSKLVLNEFRVDSLATNAGECLGGLVELSLLDEETGGVGEEEETNTKDDSPKKLDSDRDTVRARVAAALGGVNDAVGEQDTDGDAELVATDDSTTDLLGGDLGHVENDDAGNETDTKTSNETTTKFVECEQCWFLELISKNEKMPDPRAGSKPLLDSYSSNCANLSLPTQPLALQLPPDWDGPRDIELNLPATVVTVGFGGLMGATFLYLLSNI